MVTASAKKLKRKAYV